MTQKDLWWNGPAWLSDSEQWPPDITTSTTLESRAEEKVVKEIFALIQVVSDELDAVLEKFHFWKTMRVCAWIARFTRNARTTKKKRVKESLSTEEIEMQIQFWVKRAQQQSSQGSDQFERDRLQLNLQPNNEGILECRGRIQGQYPIYLPDSHS